ncbi:MAG: nitroreductase family protein [Defluviitaleaceae bacterium]|nr:nitroreductase family protein [Defluviitaleaceae bacterium]
MLLDLLKNRYSCRNFSNKKISDNVISYILECGRLSASGGNDQPWQLGVITNANMIKKLSKAASVNYDQSWIANAPLVIVLCTELKECKDKLNCMNRFPSMKEKILKMDNKLYAAVNMEEHQTKIPGEHMVLAALEYGIYSTWISSMDCEMAGEIIGIKGYLVTNLIIFGYPAQYEEATPKKDMKDITFANYFVNEEDTLCLIN